MLLGFADYYRMPLLEDLMYRDKSLECLDFVGEHRLAVDRPG
jgi:hypothetical protein